MKQIIDIKLLIELLFSEIFAESVERHHGDYVTERHTLKPDLDAIPLTGYRLPFSVYSSLLSFRSLILSLFVLCTR